MERFVTNRIPRTPLRCARGRSAAQPAGFFVSRWEHSYNRARMTLPRAILFDMDGTLTAPMLDFPRIKQEMGIGARPILEAMAEMSAADRAAAEAVLLRHEERAAIESTLNPGCPDVLAWLRERSIPTALITRNSRLSVRTFVARHGVSFDVLATRDDGRFKPDPAPLLLACRKLGVEPAHAWMV